MGGDFSFTSLLWEGFLFIALSGLSGDAKKRILKHATNNDDHPCTRCQPKLLKLNEWREALARRVDRTKIRTQKVKVWG